MGEERAGSIPIARQLTQRRSKCQKVNRCGYDREWYPPSRCHARMRLPALVLSLLFLFFYGTGQAFCFCDADDTCVTGTAVSEDCGKEAPISLGVEDNCCDNCPITEAVVTSSTFKFDLETIETPACLETFDFAQTASEYLLATIQLYGRPPPDPGCVERVPLYIYYQSLLI
jgi:hypothetical protein